MRTTYLVRLSEDHAVEAHRRHRAKASIWWQGVPMRIFSGLFLATLLGVGLWASDRVLIAIPTFFLILLILEPKIDSFIIRRRWRLVPQSNEELRVEVSENEVSSTSRTGSSTCGWSNFAKATQHRDGLMLYNTPWNYFWLPDTALVEGTPEQVRAIVRSAIAEYHVVNTSLERTRER